MEVRQIQCDNLGMGRDQAISALGKDKSGATNFAFENFNIRILTNGDNTALSVTNEKSTKAELVGNQSINGVFVGGCKLNKYLVLFVKNTNAEAEVQDSIYRIDYDGLKLRKVLLYNGNLNFGLNYPIEAVGYYESEEVQKIYWVDGYNPNRFINIADVAYIINNSAYYAFPPENLHLPDGILHALTTKSNELSYYYYESEGSVIVWRASDILAAKSNDPNVNVAWLVDNIATTYNMVVTGTPVYEGKRNPFDFQGAINKIPVAKVEKNYNEAGSFQAGVIQYFFTYYNKYGVETCIIWNSDLQYISMQDRGAKQDESVACGFDFVIDASSLDYKNYQFLRIYSCYRSSINVTSSARLVAEIDLSTIENLAIADQKLFYSDLGLSGETVNAADLKYVGGQNIIASTLDYKQDTMFFGDLKTPASLTNFCLPILNEVEVPITKGILTTVTRTSTRESSHWVYTYYKVIDGEESPVPATAEEFRNAAWYNNVNPNSINPQWDPTSFSYYPEGIIIKECPGISWIYKRVSDHKPEGVYSYKSQLNNSQEEIAGFKWREIYRFGIQFMTATGEWTTPQWVGDKYCDLKPKMEEDGYYMATASVDLTQIYSFEDLNSLKQNYIGYRLLMADMDITNRRIVEQGVINPTMFNYSDRHYNRPYAIPSWIFRPRNSQITNRHYDTLPEQTAVNAELQGIMERKVPAFAPSTENEGRYNAYMLVIAANDGGCYMQWKLIYYNSAHEIPQSDGYNKTAFGKWLDSKGNIPYNSAQDRMLANLAYLSEASEYTLNPTAEGREYFDNVEALFGDDYMVVSSNRIKGPEGVGKWEKTGGEFLNTLLNDIKSKKDPEGNELPLVFSSSMLPDGDLLRDIAYLKGNSVIIWEIIGLVVVAVAGAVASVFTAGAAAAATGVACAAIASLLGTVSATVGAVCATLTPIIACAAVAGAAGATAIAQNMDAFQETDRQMASKGFLPVNMKHDLTGNSGRQSTGHIINDLFKRFFTTESSGYIDYVALVDDQDIPFVMAASTTASIGMDFNAYVSGGALTFTTAEEDDLKHKNNLFGIDESIVTLNAPDIEETANAIENSDAYELQLIGIIPLHSVYGAYDLQCTQGLASASEVLRSRFISSKSVPSPDVLGLVNGDLYQDTDITEAVLVGCMKQDDQGNWIFDQIPQATPNVALYRQWMWNRETSIGMWLPGIPMLDALGNEVVIPPSQPTHKLFANMRYSFNTEYQNPYRMFIDSPRVCLDSEVMLKSFTHNGSIKFYYENVNTIATSDTTYQLVKNRVPYPQDITNESGTIPLKSIASLRDPIHIKYKETPHILIPIKDHDGATCILPYLSSETAVSPLSLYGDLLYEYDSEEVKHSKGYVFEGTYLPSGDTDPNLSTWYQKQLSDWYPETYPYLFMGELVKKVFDYDTWMGGTQSYALEQLHWNVASPVTDLNNNILSSWGDTYYQRWDCEKTYPFTEDDKNSVVEVLSFMLESHLNLDGRSDTNRGITNLLNLRPSNTMFNPVYGQKDNFFSYSILDEKFKKNSFEADVAWSLTKNNMSDVDSWTSLVATNQMSMEGRLGAVRKILNAGDTLLVFQDTGISMIKYNEETALQTSAGLPLQLGNTGKVNGYRIVSDVIGCHNKFSINKNSAGIFFVDDYNKAFMQYTQNSGIANIGQVASFSQWFKDNITGSIWSPKHRDAFRTSYDEVTHDLYLITGPTSEPIRNICLVYNTLLQRFTSFMSYIDTPVLTRLNSDSGKSGAFAIRQVSNSLEGWQLFEGNGYNNIYGNFVPYSMEYRINPDPTHDSIFTNYQYTADWLDPNNKADEAHVFGAQSSLTPARNFSSTLVRRFTTFDTVEAWNEYQYGKKRVDTGRVGKFTTKAKFRIWRGDIPRDGENIGAKRFMPDRMRNPWIHLRFEKLASEDDSKMIFHNLNVTYYNQYGRI